MTKTRFDYLLDPPHPTWVPRSGDETEADKSDPSSGKTAPTAVSSPRWIYNLPANDKLLEPKPTAAPPTETTNHNTLRKRKVQTYPLKYGDGVTRFLDPETMAYAAKLLAEGPTPGVPAPRPNLPVHVEITADPIKSDNIRLPLLLLAEAKAQDLLVSMAKKYARTGQLTQKDVRNLLKLLRNVTASEEEHPEVDKRQETATTPTEEPDPKANQT